jgi:hypothetical protein
MNTAATASGGPGNRQSIGHNASGDMLVKNATLSSSFSLEQIDFQSKITGGAHQSLISDNRMTHLFNRDTGPVVCNGAPVTAIEVQRQGSRVAPVPSA